LGSLIRNRNQVKQVIDFTGVQNGKLHPSDIDFVLEFDNEILILGEVKRKYNRIPTGQKLILERICDAWGEKSIAIKVEHQFNDDSKNIPLEQCKVTAWYEPKVGWHFLKEPYDFIEFINNLGKKWNNKKCSF
tara:strand:- start:415 stop:813 length:399 start_codon:yes stop_codon:yes gene_type:complete